MKIEDILGTIAVLILAGLLFTFGYLIALGNTKKAAVQAGVGEWKVKNDRGETDFYFKTNTVTNTVTNWFPVWRSQIDKNIND